MLTKQEKLKRHRIACRKYCKYNFKKARASRMKFYWENREKELATNKKRRENNWEKVRAIEKKSYKKHYKKRLAYSKKYRKENKEKEKARHKKYREDNKEKELIRHAIYRKNNRSKISKSVVLYLKRNINAKLSSNLRSRVKMAFKKQGTKKQGRFYELIGCTIPELKIYIENQFKKEMTWKNHGMYGWHIDHVKPCASFDLTNSEQQRQCFHFTNLQPLWARDNLKKGSKYENFSY